MFTSKYTTTFFIIFVKYGHIYRSLDVTTMVIAILIFFHSTRISMSKVPETRRKINIEINIIYILFCFYFYVDKKNVRLRNVGTRGPKSSNYVSANEEIINPKKPPTPWRKLRLACSLHKSLPSTLFNYFFMFNYKSDF